MSGGFTPDEWQQIYSADKNRSFTEKAIICLTPFSGIKSHALGHLRSDWITWRDTHVRIRIPPEAPINDYMLTGGDDQWPQLPNLTPRTDPCKHCRQLGDKNRFENMGKDAVGEGEGTSKRSTEIILHQDIASPAVDFLEFVFKRNGREELGVTQQVIIDMAKELDVEDSNYVKFRKTAPVLYAHYGLSADEIAAAVDYTGNRVTAIVGKTPEISFERITTGEFLRTVAETGPATAKKIANKLNTTPGNVRQRVNYLQKYNRLEIENQGHGPPALTIQATENWAEPLTWPECDFKSRSLQAVSKHHQMIHK
jgi:hypothetical protein